MPKPEDPVLNNAQKEHIVLLTKASETLQRIYALNPLSSSRRRTHNLKTTLSELLKQKITEIQENKKLTAISKDEQDMINTATADVITHIDYRIQHPPRISDKTPEEYQEIKSKLHELLPKLTTILNDEGQLLRNSGTTFEEYNEAATEHYNNILRNLEWLRQRREPRRRILDNYNYRVVPDIRQIDPIHVVPLNVELVNPNPTNPNPPITKPVTEARSQTINIETSIPKYKDDDLVDVLKADFSLDDYFFDDKVLRKDITDIDKVKVILALLQATKQLTNKAGSFDDLNFFANIQLRKKKDGKLVVMMSDNHTKKNSFEMEKKPEVPKNITIEKQNIFKIGELMKQISLTDPQLILLAKQMTDPENQSNNFEALINLFERELARIEGKPHNNEQLLLTPEQIALAEAYFENNTTQTKLSRKTRILDNNRQPVSLPYSIMKSNDQRLYALYRGKNDNLNPQNKKGLLGEGSFGRVKLAQRLDDGTIVAAKMALISKSQSIDSMSQEEAMQEAVGQYLDSTNRQNFISQENKYYIFSKFIEGESLTNVFFDPTQPESLVPKPDNSTNHERNLKIILATLKATQELHEKGITHCDLSFNNILYDLKTGDVTIIDYGHAVKFKSGFREDDPLRTLPYQIEFNPNNYTPPEFAYSTVNNRSDIYSLGRWINQAKLQPDILQRLADNMTNRDPLKRLSAKACMKIIETPELNRINTPHQNRKRR